MNDITPSTLAGAQANSSGHEHHQRHHYHPPNHRFINIAEVNRQHYDEHTDHFDDYPHVKEWAKRCASTLIHRAPCNRSSYLSGTALAIREVVPLDRDSSEVLEYPCGTGQLSKIHGGIKESNKYPFSRVFRGMLSYVRGIVGIGISPAVVERCNMRFKEEGANEGCYAFAANIVTDKDVSRGRTFDLVYVRQTYLCDLCTLPSCRGTLKNTEEITRLLGEFVKPEASLIIVDHVQIEGKGVVTMLRAMALPRTIPNSFLKEQGWSL